MIEFISVLKGIILTVFVLFLTMVAVVNPVALRTEPLQTKIENTNLSLKDNQALKRKFKYS